MWISLCVLELHHKSSLLNKRKYILLVLWKFWTLVFLRQIPPFVCSLFVKGYLQVIRNVILFAYRFKLMPLITCFPYFHWLVYLFSWFDNPPSLCGTAVLSLRMVLNITYLQYFFSFRNHFYNSFSVLLSSSSSSSKTCPINLWSTMLFLFFNSISFCSHVVYLYLHKPPCLFLITSLKVFSGLPLFLAPWTYNPSNMS